MRGSQFLVSISMVLFMVGCESIEPGEQIGQAQLGAMSANAMSANAMSANAMSANALMLEDLQSRQLAIQGATLNVNTNNGFSEMQQMLIKYTVHCALDPSDTLVVTVDGVTYSFTGSLGVAPSWRDQPLTSNALKQTMSGCLMAHVNLFGVSVPISVRSEGSLDTSVEEATRFIFHEGAFYGDIFRSSQIMYTCSGDAAPDFDAVYPGHDTTVGDRLLRRCTDSASAGDSETLCGFVYVGACSDVCDMATSDGYSQCWSDANRTGTRYDATVNAWQLAFDDPDAAWPVQYPAVYGS